MPGKHQKGDVVVPTFHASGTGRDLYLNPHAGLDKDELKSALQKPLQYTDIETGEVWVRFGAEKEAGGESLQGRDGAEGSLKPCDACSLQATCARCAGGRVYQRAASTNTG